VSVADGFLCILNDMFLSSLEKVMSKKLIFFIIFFFHSEFHHRCYVVEYNEYIMYIRYSIFINYENVIYIVEISNYIRFQQNVKYLYILIVF